MCGRFVMTAPAKAIAETFDAVGRPNLPASYNVAPTQAVAVIRVDAAGARRLNTASWGLLPRWAKDRSGQAKMINARGETVAEKPAFKSAFQRDRILVPANGFYEWRRDGSTKQPYYIRPVDRDLFAFAGLRTVWKDPESGEELATCCLLTTGPNAVMEPIHHRMPVILTDPGRWSDWLTGQTETALALIGPAPAEGMRADPVDRRVGRVQENDPGLIEPIADPGKRTGGDSDTPAQGQLL